MTKSDLVKAVAKRYKHATAHDTEIIIDTLFAAIARHLQRNGRVELRGFGSFSIRRRKRRTGRNPKTGDVVAVPEKRVAFFTAGYALRERLNAVFGQKPEANDGGR